MKKICLSVTLFAMSYSAHALDERSAAALAKKYSETVACQLEDNADQPTQYKAVRIDKGDAEMNGLGAKFVVFWQGDTGCLGGNGTIRPNFTVVEKAGSPAADPVVIDYKFPELKMVSLTSMTATKTGLLLLTGISYGPKDEQHRPTKPVKYTLKLVDSKFIIQ